MSAEAESQRRHGVWGLQLGSPVTEGESQGMWNLYRLLPPEGPTHSRIYRGRGELIEHVFASHRLVNPDNIPAVEIVAASPLPSMTDDPTPQTSARTDHAAIVVTFSL
jgi:hypothetical protein